MRALRSRFFVLSFAALLLLLGGGAVAVQSCHSETITHNHVESSLTHSHDANLIGSLDSNKLGVNFEVCFAIGFLVFLILRFVRIGTTSSKLLDYEFPDIKQTFQIFYKPWFLNLTHLQLGVIRV